MPIGHEPPYWDHGIPSPQTAARFEPARQADRRTIGRRDYGSRTAGRYSRHGSIHKTLRVTPAMAAGVTDRFLGIGDIVMVLEAWKTVGVET